MLGNFPGNRDYPGNRYDFMVNTTLQENKTNVPTYFGRYSQKNKLIPLAWVAFTDAICIDLWGV